MKSQILFSLDLEFSLLESIEKKTRIGNDLLHDCIAGQLHQTRFCNSFWKFVKTHLVALPYIAKLCNNYVPQWWVEFDDESSWLSTNRFSATKYMTVKRMGITEILRRIWLFSANKTKSSESFSKQPTQLIILAHNYHMNIC